VSEANNIDVFGNLKDFLGSLTERQVAQELERLEQIRSTMPTPAQSAYIGTLFAPGSGVADVAGELPSFPTADVPLEDFLAGEPLPSLPVNIEEGRYLDAFLQSLGAAGDAVYAAPAVGPLLGATIKGIAAIPPVVKGLTQASKTITKPEFLQMAEKGNLVPAKTPEQSLDAIVNKNTPAQDFDFLGEYDDFAQDYETGEFTKKLEDAGLYVIDNKMGRVVAGQTKADAENLLQAKNPYEFGKSYGYSDEDIAAFYLQKSGGNTERAYTEFLSDLPEGTKGIATLDKTKPAAKGIEGLRQQKIQEDVQQFARDNSKNYYSNVESTDLLEESFTNQTSYVSPTLEALIAKAPPNLKGEQISNWLKANTDKGVKPKELELLDLDSYIMQNPNATVRDVAEYGSQNKVQLVTRVIASEDAPTIDFEVSTPEFDPLDLTYKNYQYILDDLPDELANNDYTLAQFYSYYLDEQPRIFFDPSEVTDEALQARVIEFEDYLNKNNLTYDDALENFAKDQYFDNPYELVEIKSTGNIDANIPDQTFAFGNEEVGYQLFVGGERVTPDNIAFSRTEAQIQLRDKLSEYGDPLRIEGEEDYFGGGPQYKGDVDTNLPGGSDYREYVINWGNAPEPHYVSTHFPDNTQISSVLARERKLEDGTSSLHIDEMQSDLHTEGSKYGYKAPLKIKEKTLKDLDDFLKDKENYYVAYKDGKDGLRDRVTQEFISFTDIDYISEYAKQKEVTRLGSDKADKLVKYMGKDFDRLVEIIQPISKEGTTPNYPFKDDWHNMTLKNMVLQAIEEGKDTISVSTSAAMKSRYVDRYETFYETLYDKKIPSAMKKLANKYGGKFEKGKLDLDDIYKPKPGDVRLDPYGTGGERFDANILRITPEMKQKILEEGMPSFAYGGPVNKFIGPNDINVFSD